MADSRGEKLLEAILGDDTEIEPAESRAEKLLDRLLEKTQDFVVTVTPEGFEDGILEASMDTTLSDIYQAYKVGRRVLFRGNMDAISTGLIFEASIGAWFFQDDYASLEAYAIQYTESGRTFITMMVPFSTGETTTAEFYFDPL